jgi:hypothetical protein
VNFPSRPNIQNKSLSSAPIASRHITQNFDCPHNFLNCRLIFFTFLSVFCQNNLINAEFNRFAKDGFKYYRFPSFLLKNSYTSLSSAQIASRHITQNSDCPHNFLNCRLIFFHFFVCVLSKQSDCCRIYQVCKS